MDSFISFILKLFLVFLWILFLYSINIEKFIYYYLAIIWETSNEELRKSDFNLVFFLVRKVDKEIFKYFGRA